MNIKLITKKNIFITFSTITLVITSFFVSANNATGVIINELEPYPLYQYSNQQEQDGNRVIILTNTANFTQVQLRNILDRVNIPYKVISESPIIIQTEWISWHYDAGRKKTLSSQSNHFFTLNKRDKYKFRITINTLQSHPVIFLTETKRQEQVDITEDTEMVWLKWQEKEPDKNAINAFMERIQTGYELSSLLSNTNPVASKKPASNTRKNSMTLNRNVQQTWTSVVKQLTNKSIALSDVHNNQHMLNTQWVYTSFEPDIKNPGNSNNIKQRHQFQIIVAPSSSINSATIFTYHTAFQEKKEKSNSTDTLWSDKETKQAIAGEFLHSLNLTP